MNCPLTQPDVQRREIKVVPDRRIRLRTGPGTFSDKRVGHDHGEGKTAHAQARQNLVTRHRGIVEDDGLTCPAGGRRQRQTL